MHCNLQANFWIAKPPMAHCPVAKHETNHQETTKYLNHKPTISWF